MTIVRALLRSGPRWRLAILAGLGFMLLAAIPVFAQEPFPSDDEVNAIAKNLYCPVCENVPLDVCPTQACIQWRDQIREKLAEGWNREQIYDYFVRQYGDRVLAEPPRTGLNWLVYTFPPLAILAGAWILFRVLRAWRVEPEALTAEAAESPPSEYVARLEEELRRRE